MHYIFDKLKIETLMLLSDIFIDCNTGYWSILPPGVSKGHPTFLNSDLGKSRDLLRSSNL